MIEIQIEDVSGGQKEREESGEDLPSDRRENTPPRRSTRRKTREIPMTIRT